MYDDLIRQGKIRHAALSSHPAWQLTEALWIADDRRLVSGLVAAQVKYSLLDRNAEKELAATPAFSRKCHAVLRPIPIGRRGGRRPRRC